MITCNASRGWRMPWPKVSMEVSPHPSWTRTRYLTNVEVVRQPSQHTRHSIPDSSMHRPQGPRVQPQLPQLPRHDTRFQPAVRSCPWKLTTNIQHGRWRLLQRACFTRLKAPHTVLGCHVWPGHSRHAHAQGGRPWPMPTQNHSMHDWHATQGRRGG